MAEKWNSSLVLDARLNTIQELKQKCFDVVIIGGGATGAGALLDAASRGLKVALLEAFDFSFGTSSRSTKLVHGGVRYLENAIKTCNRNEYLLVRDALKERKYFLKNAPHLAKPIKIITPVYSIKEAIYYLLGLKIYDLISSHSSLGSSKFIGKDETIKLFPKLKRKKLLGSVLYFDGQFNDARMNMSLILSGITAGGKALNHARVNGFIKNDGKICGINVFDSLTKKNFSINAKVVINATGPFADSIRNLDNKDAAPLIKASRGSHLILPRYFAKNDAGLVIPKTKDGRVLFLLPFLGKTLVGTTDIPQNPHHLPQVDKDECAYLLKHLKDYFDDELSPQKIHATFSGLRPLARLNDENKKTASLSRDHVIDISKSNLISIVGGKWTTYRKMALDVIDAAIKTAHLTPKNKSRTAHTKLIGATEYKKGMAHELTLKENIDKNIAKHLIDFYGDQAKKVIEIAKVHGFSRLIKEFPYLEAEVIYQVRYEYAFFVTDVLATRLRLSFIDYQAAKRAVPTIVRLMSKELNQSQKWVREQKEWAYKLLETMSAKSCLGEL